jgi:hypothetical protein
MEGGDVGHIFERDPPRDHPCQAWFKLVQRFQRKPLNQIKPNLAGMVSGWVPFKIVSDSPALHSRWLLLLKIEIAWRPSWLEIGINGHNFGRGPSKNHFSKIWLILAQ